jgi:hypothetical protein
VLAAAPSDHFCPGRGPQAEPTGFAAFRRYDPAGDRPTTFPPVSARVGNVKNNDPWLIKPVGVA